jgi:hypothetical protein
VHYGKLLRAISKVYVSFNRKTTKDSKRGFLAYYVTTNSTLQDLPIALREFLGAHSGDGMAKVVVTTLQAFKMAAYRVGYCEAFVGRS